MSGDTVPMFPGVEARDAETARARAEAEKAAAEKLADLEWRVRFQQAELDDAREALRKREAAYERARFALEQAKDGGR